MLQYRDIIGYCSAQIPGVEIVLDTDSIIQRYYRIQFSLDTRGRDSIRYRLYNTLYYRIQFSLDTRGREVNRYKLYKTLYYRIQFSLDTRGREVNRYKL